MKGVYSNTCTTPDQAWALICHHINNQFLSVRLATQKKRDDWENRVASSRAEFVGHLCMISKQMNGYGYYGVAAQVEQILVLATGDVTDPKVQDAVYAVYDKHYKNFQESQATNA